ncbi:riboflavin biosynthesis protein RibA [Plasticicumulans sp.]|nr:riboflavin biosynthesis protein RibA [Plasticicumulans sp.]MBS0601421.1 riboflavin biosynthesis protein RibA [Pseudomonadota bacterium]HMW29960.1 riboflavin biosynthesis protein RibA [Plasticicumulans sp.]HMW43434.1 riboflavin biosynthesis protein RibA [Plasticicumulans sp.]HMX53647.1 riboflavin biosynthesis protein RibA [Plasticicumulans sp.]HND98217.1 riboflavin biosynthesis protein RibA [Plasticicumulans sp.]
MVLSSLIFGERSLSKVAGLFDTADEARSAANTVRSETGMSDGQVMLVQPNDAAFGRKLEPEQRRIPATLIRTHVVFGAIGLGLGALIALTLMLFGVDAVTSNALIALVVFSVMGLMLGLMFGGFLSLRPDHDVVISAVMSATRHGHWAVVAHPLDEAQKDSAVRAMEHTHATKVVKTF